MNPTDVLFVVCTRFDAEQYKTTPTYTSLAKLEKLYGEIPTRVFYQNKRGLPECYNEAIRDCQQPFVVFIHDDIFIIKAHACFIPTKIPELRRQYFHRSPSNS